MRSVVLGAGGFMGAHLCRALLASGHEVRAFDKASAPYLNHVRQLGAEAVIGDLMGVEDMGRVLSNCETVFHLMWATVPESADRDPGHDAEVNILGTIRMLDAARLAKVHRIIFASSGGTVYGVTPNAPITEDSPTNPVSAYGIGKVAVENYVALYARLHGVNHTVLRIANAYGEGQRSTDVQGVIASFVSRAVLGQALNVRGDGSAVRDFIHVDDIVRAFIKVLDYNGKAKVFNVGTGRGTSINEVIAMIETAVGKSLPRKHLASRPFDIPANVLDISLARAELDWQPEVELGEGIRRTLRWVRNGRQGFGPGSLPEA